MAYKPIDITNNWMEDNLSEIIYRYNKRVDTKDRKLLLLFRILGLKYRMLHTIKSNFKNQLVVEEEIRLLLNIFILESGFNYITKGDMFIIN